MKIRVLKKFMVMILIIMLCGETLAQDSQSPNFRDVAFIGTKAQPVKIINFITNETKEDWLNGLTIEVENISNKPIYYFRYAMSIRIEGKEIPVGCQFVFNEQLRKDTKDEKLVPENTNLQPLLPSEKIKLSLPLNLSFGVKGLVEKDVSLSQIKKVDFILQIATYNDKTYWCAANEFDSLSNKRLD